MVGRKTSPRCAICRKRKIKCDLRAPSCSQCLKSKWQCPGYETHSRFYTYNKHFSQHTGHETASSSDTEHITPSTAISTRTSRSSSIANFPLSAADSLRNEFVFKITFDAVSARMMVVSEHQILRLIPVRIGSSLALDDAVKCVCGSDNNAQATSLLTPRKQSSPQLYAKALQRLQRALLDPAEANTAETMAAAMLLQMHEHSTRHAAFGWVAHANGVIRMLELRGPSRITTDLDKAIFRAQVGNIFIHALRDNKPCWLADPEWHALIPPGDEPDIAFGAMIDVGLFIPGIVCQYEEYRAQNETMSSDRLENIVREILRVQKRAETWRLHCAAEIGSFPTTPSSDTQVSRLTHASMLSLNIFLMLLEYMGLDLRSSGIEVQLTSELGMSFISDEHISAAMIKRFRDLATESKLEFCLLYENDAMAATNTAWLMGALLSRILAATRQDFRLRCLQEPMNDLLFAMKLNVEPLMELSHIHGVQID